MRLSRVQPLRALLGLALLGLLCLSATASVARAGSEQQSAACSGYYYTVKSGDTWSSIGRRVGAPVSVLKAANPSAVRPRDLIYAGEKLCIPSQGGVEQGGYWYQVKPGDTWNSVARRTGIPVEQLWNANRQLVNQRLWLYLGQRIWIPAPPKGGTPEATAAVTVSPTATTIATTAVANPPAAAPATPEATPSATPAPSATPVAPTPTVAVPTATSVPPTSTVPPTPVPPTFTATTPPTPSSAAPVSMPTAGAPIRPKATVTPTAVSAAATQAATAVPAQPTPTLPPVPADCPKDFVAYPDALATYLNKAQNTPAKLQNWLVACRAVSEGSHGVTVAPITAPKAADVIVAIHDPAEVSNAHGMLLVYHSSAKGYTLAHKRTGQGRIELVQAADVNADGRFDLVYTDSICGAHTCFGTLFVDSWNGKAYEDWITDDPTMAEPEYTVKDATPDGQGNEILVHGGVIDSVGAGLQRAWTETYISPKGAPYLLFSQVYDPSSCLYHKILDANRAFEAWALDGFDPAIEAYKAAVGDAAAEPCGTIKDEVATLRDFARFRLIVADVAAGRATEGLPLLSQITATALRGAATTFLNSYKDNTSVIQACRDTTKYAEANPSSWQFLADWGYANPSFTAQDLCPLN